MPKGQSQLDRTRYLSHLPWNPLCDVPAVARPAQFSKQRVGGKGAQDPPLTGCELGPKAPSPASGRSPHSSLELKGNIFKNKDGGGVRDPKYSDPAGLTRACLRASVGVQTLPGSSFLHMCLSHPFLGCRLAFSNSQSVHMASPGPRLTHDVPASLT